MNRHTFRRRGRQIVLTSATCLAIGAAPLVASPASANTSEAPKNVIVLISDGAGYNQFDAARLYDTGTSYQQVTVDPDTGAIEHAESKPSQVYDSWPVQVGQSHYSASGRSEYVTESAWGDFGWVASGATDSAAAATALGTGVKTNNGVIGFDPEGERLMTVGEQAKAVGKKVGLVTDVPFAHATPAGFIAHNADRNDYHGLANEMIDSGIDVIIGGGHPNYTDANTTRPSHFGSGSWISQGDYNRLVGGETPFTFIDAKNQFEQVASGQNVPEKLFGLARVAETFQYNRPGLDNDDVAPYSDPMNSDVPSLETAADAALQVLDNDEGFFLMVEAGAVDWAGHANQTTRLIEEQKAFNAAVESVNEWVEQNSSWDETLVVVTADHETGYLAGPGAGPDTGWTELTGEAGQLPELSWHSGGHTNALVPFYAKGAGSQALQSRAVNWDLVRGAYLDNTDVGEVIFDFLGLPAAETQSGYGLEATVPFTAPQGELALTVPNAGSTIRFTGDAEQQNAPLPQLVVTDSRNEAQAQGKGWTVSGKANAFVAGNRSFGADALSWIPRIVSSEGGASAGGVATLEAPATLAQADRETRVGTTTVSADLALDVPSQARAGRYGSEITLTLFAKD
ncbi:alkaline phosphatase [uncultured Aeromicrobium sp.]|uniref:alkaline phosphatase n=1 Tax=uncultured Aeromicrobium sp. TaxID=337820 RepID=UPI0025FBF289|nr:alkaline phosphatase [uncultured Aeromicrobium sp.]